MILVLLVSTTSGTSANGMPKDRVGELQADGTGQAPAQAAARAQVQAARTRELQPFLQSQDVAEVVRAERRPAN